MPTHAARTGGRPLLLPRHREAATRAVAYFMLAAGLVIGLLATLLPGFAGEEALGRAATITVALLMVVTGAVCWRVPHWLPDGFWLAVPFVAIALTAGLDLLTRDASLGAHLYFLWPALYAAMYLRRPAVYAVLATVVVGDGMVVFALTPPARAVADLASMATAVIIAMLIIMRLRERADNLVAVLEAQALADPLTGLPNRRAFAQDLEEAVARARRTDTPLSLMTVDVDHFKAVNDEFGHPAGDAALVTVAGALRAAVRRSDVIARYGGDEFVALIEAGPEGALRVAEALRGTVAAATDLPSGPPTLSIGVASLPPDADTAESLMVASDAALYAAKLAGRNRIWVAGASTDPPTAGPPTAGPPATDPPTADPPTADPPTADPPTADPPAAGPPTADPPAAGPPAGGGGAGLSGPGPPPAGSPRPGTEHGAAHSGSWSRAAGL